MDRREFLSLGSIAALLPIVPAGGASAQAAAGPGDEALNRLFEAIFQEQVASFPTFATQLGLDKDERAGLRAKLDTRPNPRARAENLAQAKRWIASLEAVPPASLSPTAALNREVVLWDLKTANVGPERFDISNPQSPYVISQQDGAYFSVPDFLASAHPI